MFLETYFLAQFTKSIVLFLYDLYVGINPKYPVENPPAPKVLGRDLPDGTRKRLQVYLGGGGHFSAKTSCF